MTATPDQGSRTGSIAGSERPAFLSRFQLRGAVWLAAPAVLVLVIALAYPLAIVVVRSFTDPAPGIDNYVWFFQSAVNRTVLQRTFVVAAWVTLVSLICAYPYAYAMTIAGRNMCSSAPANRITSAWMTTIMSRLIFGFSKASSAPP